MPLGLFMATTPAGAVWAATAIALVVWGVLAALEFRRFDGARRAWRLGAITLTVGCLWTLFAGPEWNRQVQIDEAILLTPGWSAEHGPIEPVQTSRGDASTPIFAVDTAAPRGAIAVPDVGFLSRHYPGIRRLNVHGYGLPSFEWERTDAAIVASGTVASIQGVHRIRWAREIRLGDTWDVRGQWTSGSGASVQLRGPGGVADKQDLPAREESPAKTTTLNLQATPPRVGSHSYWLEVLAENGTVLTQERLDVVVQEPQTVAVLWLEGAPRFETRHFKHWLTRRGDALIVRSTLSRDRERVERFNHPQVNVSRLTARLLGGFDLVVLDARSLSRLGRRERAALAASIHDGLGVLVLPADLDAAQPPSPTEPTFLTHWPTRPIADIELFAARPQFQDGSRTAALEIAPREIVLGEGLAPLLQDGAGTVLAASRIHGRGTVGFSLLEDSFRWVLEGNADDHANYWSHIISQLARRRADPRWQVADGVVLVDEPRRLALELSEEQPGGLAENLGTLENGSTAPECVVRDGRGDLVRLAPRQDPLDPRRWEATLLPRSAGWHTVETSGGTTTFLVQPRSAWTSWQQARSQLATARQPTVFRPGSTDLDDSASSTSRRTGVPGWLLFAGILGSLGFLWADERRSLGQDEVD